MRTWACVRKVVPIVPIVDSYEIGEEKPLETVTLLLTPFWVEVRDES